MGHKNPSAVKELAAVTTPFAFTHNAWPSDDGKYVLQRMKRKMPLLHRMTFRIWQI